MRNYVSNIPWIAAIGIFANLASMAAMENCPLPTVIEFSYNNFTLSPYSQSMAAIPFDSDEGIAIFERSDYKKAFFKLAPHYAPQQMICSCAIASAVIILNAVDAHSGQAPPLSKKGACYVPETNTLYAQYVWTEDNFYNDNVSNTIDRPLLEGKEKVCGAYQRGLELDRLTLALNLQGLTAEAHHVVSANTDDIEAFRNTVKIMTANPIKYLIVNYNVAIYDRQGGGHVSPVAAYEAITDTVLILDTAADANGWLWIKLTDLYQSMHTMDSCSYRGYILIDACRSD